MWWYVVVFVVALVAAYSMMPKPQNAKPAGLGDVTAPTAEVGREIPVLFGERDLEGPNVCWYGDFRAVPIKKKGGKK
ncbi:putative virion structural protein [Xanthomonas phage vB_Xar_IVIA-DoCa5]|uniref:Virion structural protein n=1 Tax=Xanthomonas phage vB_Xar_IVIA-DoCa5 TaxID=2975532 RepID=A0A9X9JN53_9CAUD|nr:putative virion structural protein [Xanthomonas phage vB_Xar_IVIA-DoCa5]UYA98699.1 putative virion structural protein [Xanthomonas phage vB_Xar_IVIA-DoCa5]